MFIDASALCAILLGEPEKREFAIKILRAERPTTSAVAAWETARALIREENLSASQAGDDGNDMLAESGVELVPIGDDHFRLALDAFERFGKGRHPAALNMGDCFAYACAKAARQPLLYKGEDFAQTDIEAA